jgi:hypothetical protein
MVSDLVAFALGEGLQGRDQTSMLDFRDKRHNVLYSTYIWPYVFRIGQKLELVFLLHFKNTRKRRRASRRPTSISRMY